MEPIQRNDQVYSIYNAFGVITGQPNKFLLPLSTQQRFWPCARIPVIDFLKMESTLLRRMTLLQSPRRTFSLTPTTPKLVLTPHRKAVAALLPSAVIRSTA